MIERQYSGGFESFQPLIQRIKIDYGMQHPTRISYKFNESKLHTSVKIFHLSVNIMGTTPLSAAVR
jgi:hypothetical protein